MTLVEFCRAHGIIIDETPPLGRWVRYPTTDHPKKRNGAVKNMGVVGFCQNHAQQVDVSVWRPEADAVGLDMTAINKAVERHDKRMHEGWARAEREAADALRQCKTQEHNYLHIKGFGDTPGLVMPDGALMIPMRHWQTNRLVGAQFVRWLDDEERYQKKMMPGMRAKGAVLRLGSPKAARTWLVEGYATALSVEAAVRVMNLRDAVLCCFSDGNLVHVASLVVGDRLVFADNDLSGAGERAAQRAGLRYCMSGTVGHDANDAHKADGVFKVASLMMDAINSEVMQV